MLLTMSQPGPPAASTQESHQIRRRSARVQKCTASQAAALPTAPSVLRALWAARTLPQKEFCELHFLEISVLELRVGNERRKWARGGAVWEGEESGRRQKSASGLGNLTRSGRGRDALRSCLLLMLAIPWRRQEAGGRDRKGHWEPGAPGRIQRSMSSQDQGESHPPCPQQGKILGDPPQTTILRGPRTGSKHPGTQAPPKGSPKHIHSL